MILNGILPQCTPICVIFVRLHRPSQDWLRHHATPLIVHCEHIRAALIWLKAHNHLYRNDERV